MAHSVDVQSIVYRNDPADLLRTVEAASHAASIATQRGTLSGWAFRFGDCSPEEALSEADRKRMSGIVSEHGGAFEYCFFGENLGHGGGHNRLFAMGHHSQILILNPDGLLAPTCLEELLGAAAADVGIVEARQLPIEHPKEYDPVTRETGWAAGACLLIPRDTYGDLGGFDHETFFMYCDDVDFSWRARLSGLRLLFLPEARFFHDKRLGPAADWPASEAEWYYSAEAALLLPYKFSRDDVLERNLGIFRGSGDQYHRRALAEFERRREGGELPQRLDPDRRVAEFVGTNYSQHRY